MINIKDVYSNDLKNVYYDEIKKEFTRVINKRTRSGRKKLKFKGGNIFKLINQCKKIIGKENILEYFTGGNYEEDFKQLIIMPPEKLDNLARLIKYRMDQNIINKKVFQEENIQRLKAVYTEGNILGKKIEAKKINILLVKELDIAVCPYCNRNYVNSRDDKLGAQMDHFYNKDKYPIFAVSIYNFIPVCGVCNNIKRTIDFYVYPFLEDREKKHEVKFSYLMKGIDDIEIEYSTSIEKKSDMDAINLKEAYSIHDTDVRKMLDREERYSELYRQELRVLLKSNYDTDFIEFNNSFIDDDIDRLIYGDIIFENDIRNISLGKFRKDIYQEIKSMRDGDWN